MPNLHGYGTLAGGCADCVSESDTQAAHPVTQAAHPRHAGSTPPRVGSRADPASVGAVAHVGAGSGHVTARGLRAALLPASSRHERKRGGNHQRRVNYCDAFCALLRARLHRLRSAFPQELVRFVERDRVGDADRVFVGFAGFAGVDDADDAAFAVEQRAA
jgi:hypothetical protein